MIFQTWFFKNQLQINRGIVEFHQEHAHTFIIAGCEIPGFYGDTICDDENNNEACFFDGGDCCGSNANLMQCTECQCLEGEGGGTGGFGTTPSGACNQGWIADGYCDDINNNQACTYDGGDCCGSNVNTFYCTECQCLEWGEG